ncbi:MAG: 1,4-dihydroxy-6-naphthoate synthase [Desulfurivibrio sp.]|nr:1,4-dihydroxy-6-naphthoate synthase [Desulfurivibrio sp.]
MSDDNLLTLGFSPCPNDTFIFHALVHGLVEQAPPLAPPCLEDVETLNHWALEGRLAITKLSFHALGHVLDKYTLLTAGAALGRGCGPLLVARRPLEPAALVAKRVAVPGRYTTAALLLGLFAPHCQRPLVLRFDQIMPALARGEIDAGVIIHESRFTYREHGLVLLADLGAWWEESSGLPIPLGGIAARRELGSSRLTAIEAAIRRSVELAWAAPERAMPYIRRHAGELDDAVVRAHIELYVNDFSQTLGEQGQAAIAEFWRRGRQAGLLPPA